MNVNPSARLQWPAWTAICCLAILAALVLGVGVGSHLVLRHVVQTVPLWIGVILGFRRSQLTGWAALPLFIFWFGLMTVIWLCLLGIAQLVHGSFSTLEIAMTVIVGLASIVGVAVFTRLKSSLSWITQIVLFIVMLAVQVGCFMCSFMPAIEHR